MPIINQVVKGSGGSAPSNYISLSTDANGKLTPNATIVLSPDIDIGDRAFEKFSFKLSGAVDLSAIKSVSGVAGCSQLLYQKTSVTSVDLSNLESATGSNAFYEAFNGCSALTSIDLSNLETVSGSFAFYHAFIGCTSLTSIYLPKITSGSYNSSQNMFSSAFGQSGLQIADLRNLRSSGDYGILSNMFWAAANLSYLNLNALEHIGEKGAVGLAPAANSNLSNLYFPMLTTFGTDPFGDKAFMSRSNLTIHFRKDAQATVEALANYSTMWGAGTGSSVVFDLAGTLTGADSNSYTRSEIDSVYASETAGAAKTATAWKNNNVVYYTSGGSDPSVSDAIYSDAACTQSVTTITAIS